MEITEKMVLALLKNGFEYELEGAEMEMEIPVSAFPFTSDFENEAMIKMTFKYAGLKMKITKND